MFDGKILTITCQVNFSGYIITLSKNRVGSQGNTKSPFEFTGEHLGLDFANTVNDRPTDPIELLASYLDVLRWGKEAGVLNQRTADRLSRLAEEAPGRAQSALR